MDSEFQFKKAWKRYFFKRKIKTCLYYLSTFLLIFAIVYFGLSFPAQIVKIKYFLRHLIGKEDNAEILLPKIAETNFSLPNIKEKAQEIKKQTTGLSLADLEDNHLLIPKINIKAPIIWNSEVDEKIVMKNLQKGVVHYKGTALPDERGNVFIVGHSSGAWWRPGSYKTVFALLDKLQKGDEIALAYQNKVYIYKVIDKIVVKPQDVWVMAPTPEPILSLMTCVPVGTDLRRLVVKSSPLSIIDKQIQKRPKIEPSFELPRFLYP